MFELYAVRVGIRVPTLNIIYNNVILFFAFKRI